MLYNHVRGATIVRVSFDLAHNDKTAGCERNGSFALLRPQAASPLSAQIETFHTSVLSVSSWRIHGIDRGEPHQKGAESGHRSAA